MFKRLLTCLAAVALGASFAMADDKHDPGHDHAGKHGGVVMHSGHHHLELVAKGGSIALYIEHEDGKPEDVEGANASATVLADGKVEQVTLKPAGGNKLEGSGDFTAGRGTTVVVTLTMPGHEPEQARFKLD